MKKVACFFTGGFSESGAMSAFLLRINPRVQLKQFCPNKPLKKWKPGVEAFKQPKIVKDQNGLTGSALISYIFKYIDEHLEELKGYDAVLIEDDLDDRFSEEVVPGDARTRRKVKNREFQVYCDGIADRIRYKLSKDNSFPVIQIYASPELEAWFWGDWNNSFGYAYGPKSAAILSQEENEFFSNRFRTYLKENVIGDYSDYIE